MRFRNLTTDDRRINGVGFVEAGAEFDLPKGFDVAGIAHQDIYEPVDAEATKAVAALLAELEEDPEPEPVAPPVPVRLTVSIPTDTAPEQENN